MDITYLYNIDVVDMLDIYRNCSVNTKHITDRNLTWILEDRIETVKEELSYHILYECNTYCQTLESSST